MQFQDFYKLPFFLCLEVNCVMLPVLKEGVRIAMVYCTVHFSTQKSETLFPSRKYLGFFFFSFNPLQLVHKTGLH